MLRNQFRNHGIPTGTKTVLSSTQNHRRGLPQNFPADPGLLCLGELPHQVSRYIANAATAERELVELYENLHSIHLLLKYGARVLL